MHPKVFDYSQQHNLFAAGEKVVIGVSGGADSVAALRVLHELKDILDISLSVAHLNHGFRGAAARRDADFVDGLCANLNVPFYAEEVNVPGILASAGGSPQQEARKQRFCFFDRVATRIGAGTIVLGHHKDDQAETILLHILRGSGPGGMEGMRAKADYQGLNIVRPLLCVGRDDVVTYLQGLGQPYCVDASNFKEDYTRNFVRLRVFPALKEVNPRVTELLCRLGTLMADDNEVLGQQVDNIWPELSRSDEDGIHLKVQAVCSLPKALGRRVIRRAWQTMHEETADLEYVHVEAILNLFSGHVGRTLDLPRETVALRQRNWVSLHQKVAFMPYDYPLIVPGETSLPGNMVIRAELVSEVKSDYQSLDPHTAYVQISTGRMGVRTRLPGDRYQPVGFSGHRKVKDMMSEAQIPRHLRDMWPIVVHDDRIVWVPGARVCEDYKIIDHSQRVVKLNFMRRGNTVEQGATRSTHQRPGDCGEGKGAG